MKRPNLNFAFDQFDVIDRTNTPAQLTAALVQAANQFGFKACAIVAFPDPSVPFEQGIFSQDFPPGWLEHYLAQNYHDVDPILKRASTLFRPFEWTTQSFLPEAGERTARMMNEAAEHGLVAGFCVPTHTPQGPVAVGFAGDRVELSQENRAALCLISLYAQTRVSELIGLKTVLARQANPLSPREREVLKWSSEDKTTNEIADVLGISANTVITHVASACRKLGVSSRTAAVAKALRAKII
jgi:LuxR family quorum sensing-dependent transcriptional regulator